MISLAAHLIEVVRRDWQVLAMIAAAALLAWQTGSVLWMLAATTYLLGRGEGYDRGYTRGAETMSQQMASQALGG